MIILIDNENYMIRLCKNDPDIYGFHPSFPNWKEIVKFLSDTNHMVVLSGEEQEQWLDENNIYYVHVESKPKESFETFKRRMYRQIEENKEFIQNSLSFGTLVYAEKVNGERGTVDTANVLEVWRLNEDDRYHFALSLPTDLDNIELALRIESIASRFQEWRGTEHSDDEERKALTNLLLNVIAGNDFNIYTADTMEEVYGQLIFIAESCVAGVISAEDICADKDESPIKAHYDDMDSTDGLDWFIADLAKGKEDQEDEVEDDEVEYEEEEDDDAEEEDDDVEVHSMSIELEDNNGKVSCKVNGKEVSEDELKDMLADSLAELLDAISQNR